MTTQCVDAMKEKLMTTTRTTVSKRSRPAVDKTKDIEKLVKCLRSTGNVKDVNWPSFKSFKEPLSLISANDLHSWIIHQKNISDVYMK